MKSRKQPQRNGQALLEFALAAIPMIFLLISIEEMARGMWIYTTLAHAIKEGARYSVVHGADCVLADPACQITVGQLATFIKTAGVGLDPGHMNVVLQTVDGSLNCQPLSTCVSNPAAWPASPGNSMGLPVTISGTYPFNTFMSMFVPHAGSVTFGPMLFAANSEEEIRY